MPPCVGRFHRPNSSVVSLTSRDSQHSDLVWPDRRPAAGPQVHPQVPDGPLPAALADPAWVGRGRRTWQALPRLLSHSAATPLGTNHVSYQWLLLYNVSWMIWGWGVGGFACVTYRSENRCLAHRKSDTENRSLTWSDLWIISVDVFEQLKILNP